MTEEFQKKLGLFFVIYPFVISVIMLIVPGLSWSHPFILVNISLIAMGAGLSTSKWLFGLGTIATLVFSVYTVLMLPSNEALQATSEATENLRSEGKPTTILEAFTSSL